MRHRSLPYHRYESGPDMTPLVDVVMVILIFLMLVGTFAGTEWYLQQNLPVSQKAVGGRPPPGGVPEAEPFEIRVDPNATQDGFIARAGSFQTGDAAALTRVLTQKRQQLESIGKKLEDVPVQISPSGSVKYRYLIRVYEAAQDAGFTKIGFTTAR